MSTKAYESDEVVVLRIEHALMKKQLGILSRRVAAFQGQGKWSRACQRIQNARGNIRQMHKVIVSQKQKIYDLEEALLSVDPLKLAAHDKVWIRWRLESRQKAIMRKREGSKEA